LKEEAVYDGNWIYFFLSGLMLFAHEFEENGPKAFIVEALDN
jgi:hypothetical protein